MKKVAALFLAMFAGGLGAEELPDLIALSSKNFEKREAAQTVVFDWVVANHEVAKEILLERYLKTDDSGATRASPRAFLF